MICIGLDVHDRNTTVAICDDFSCQVAKKPDTVATNQLSRYLMKVPREDTRIALEAGGGKSLFVARELVSCGFDVVMVDPFRTNRFFESVKTSKSDRLDAQALAEALARGLLDNYAVWIPDDDTRRLREVTRARRHLVNDNTALRNRIRRLLARYGLRCRARDLLGMAAQSQLHALAEQLPVEVAVVLNVMIGQLRSLRDGIRLLESLIRQMVKDNPMVLLLQTMPSMGLILSSAIAAEIGTIKRFASAAKLRGYSGLVPTNEQSGDRSYTGPLRLRGNAHLRWALIQLATCFTNTTSTAELSLRKRHQQKVYVHGPNPARVDLARKLTTIVFAMLRDGTEFDLERYLPVETTG
jgi:transposase